MSAYKVHRAIFVLCLWCALAHLSHPNCARAQSPELVKDINDYPASDAVERAAMVGPNVFYTSFDPQSGVELYVADTSSGQRSLLKDIKPGPSSAEITDLTVVNGNSVIFSADDGTHGREPWVSDGTPAGTRLLKDINPSGTSSPYGFSTAAGFLTFGANDGVHGTELWTSDVNLTEAGTRLLFDLNVTGGSDPGEVIRLAPPFGMFDFDLFLRAKVSDAIGNELVKVPFVALGGGFGAPQVFDLNPSGDSFPAYLTRVGNGTFFFIANDGTNGHELWVSDGDPPGPGATYMVQNLAAGSAETLIGNFAGVGNDVVFTSAFSTTGDEPFTSDGTLNAIALHDLVPGPKGSHPTEFTPLGNTLIFNATTSSGSEVWKTDGSSFSQIANIAGGSDSSDPFGFFSIGSRVLFSADDNLSGRELWQTDGVIATLAKDIFPGVSGSQVRPVASNGTQVAVIASDPQKTSLWTSDGTEQGTVPAVDLTHEGTVGSGPSNFLEAGGRLLFTASTFENGQALWMTDGTAAGTSLLADLEAGNRFNAGHLPVGKLGLFQHMNSKGERSLWRTDGTVAGTVPISSASFGGFSGDAVELSGVAYFSAETIADNRELFRSDGTAAGTFELKEIKTGDAGSTPQEFTVLGDKFLFSADDGVIGNEPWISDGTAAGTQPLKDLQTGGASFPRGYAVVGGRAVFSAFTTATGSEVFVTDGTPGGTGLLSDLAPDALGSGPVGFTALDADTLIFRANPTGRDVDPDLLFRTNGRPGGTVQIPVDGVPGFEVESIGPAINGKLFFRASDTAHGSEPWITDGTSAGTFLLQDVSPGTDSSMPSSPVEVSGKLFFTARDPAHGREPWVTDGTPAGTRVLEIETAVTTNSNGDTFGVGSQPSNLTSFRGSLYLNATTITLGAELWKVTVDGCPDDPQKLGPGACGCGTVDADANGNGVADCLSSTDLRAQLTALGELLKMLHLPRNRRDRKNMKLLAQQIRAAGSAAQEFGALNVGSIPTLPDSNLVTLLKKVAKKSRRAARLSAGTFRKDKKGALKAAQAALNSLA